MTIVANSISLPKYSPAHPCAIHLATPACATPHAALRNGATWQKWQGSPQSAARSLNLGNQRDKNINSESVTQWGAWCLLSMVKSWPWWFWNNIICDSYHWFMTEELSSHILSLLAAANRGSTKKKSMMMFHTFNTYAANKTIYSPCAII